MGVVQAIGEDALGGLFGARGGEFWVLSDHGGLPTWTRREDHPWAIIAIADIEMEKMEIWEVNEGNRK